LIFKNECLVDEALVQAVLPHQKKSVKWGHLKWTRTEDPQDVTKIADQTVILRKADARVLAVLVVHQEVVHLRQVVHQGVQAPVLVHHAPVLVTKRNQTVKTDEDLIAEAVVAVVPEVDLEMTEILEEIETGQAEVGIIETKIKKVTRKRINQRIKRIPTKLPKRKKKTYLNQEALLGLNPKRLKSPKA